MTKFEAWKAWCETAGTADLATEFTLEQSSHGRAFSFAWDAAAKAEREECAKVCDDKAKETFSGQCQTWGDYFARAIRARSNT